MNPLNKSHIYRENSDMSWMQKALSGTKGEPFDSRWRLQTVLSLSHLDWEGSWQPILKPYTSCLVGLSTLTKSTKTIDEIIDNILRDTFWSFFKELQITLILTCRYMNRLNGSASLASFERPFWSEGGEETIITDITNDWDVFGFSIYKAEIENQAFEPYICHFEKPPLSNSNRLKVHQLKILNVLLKIFHKC